MVRMAGQAPMTLHVFDLPQIAAVASKPLIFSAVRDALIAHAEGQTQVPPPLHLEFPDADGDCHVKAGHVAGAPYFAVKVAAGFYRNAERGFAADWALKLQIQVWPTFITG